MSLELAKKEALKQLELACDQLMQVDGAVDLALSGLKDELKKLIKGGIDDMIIDAIAPGLIPALKASLAQQIEKISEEV